MNLRSEGFQLFIPGMFAQGSGTCKSENKRRNLKCDLRQKRLWEKYAAASAEDGTGTVWKYKRADPLQGYPGKNDSAWQAPPNTSPPWIR